MIVSAFAALVSNGGAPRASMAMGKGDYDEAEKILGNSVALQIVISAVLTVLLLLFYRPLLLTFGASENTIGFASDYMKIYAAGTVFVQLTLGMNAFITAQGFARTGMLSVMIGAGCNIVLDPVLIYGFGIGSPWSGDRDGNLSGGVDSVGSLVPDGKKDCIKKSAKSICAWKRAWYFRGWHLDLPRLSCRQARA